MARVESVVHWGDYGCSQTKEKIAREREQSPERGIRWHMSLTPAEITRLLRRWGVARGIRE